MTKEAQLTQPDGTPYTYETLAVAPPDVLEAVMRRGQAPALSSLVGWEFKGYNTPDITRLIGIRKFKKGFYQPLVTRDPGTEPEVIGGYNVKIRQNHSLALPWEDLLQHGTPARMGWYEVRRVDLGEEDNRYPNALILNYGRSPRNPVLDPSRFLRDYLVQVYPDNPDLLLGKAFVALGFLRVFAGYFVLGRENRGPAPETL